MLQLICLANDYNNGWELYCVAILPWLLQVRTNIARHIHYDTRAKPVPSHASERSRTPTESTMREQGVRSQAGYRCFMTLHVRQACYRGP